MFTVEDKQKDHDRISAELKHRLILREDTRRQVAEAERDVLKLQHALGNAAMYLKEAKRDGQTNLQY